ncbi:hypothetical protein MMC26_003939 [Xylographa opegraphella]|nr:hypothetical protein [Xylographa opegraphella]
MTSKAVSPTSSSVHTLIIGAGISGLAAASTFHRCAPSSSLLILDANTSVGGVWATENLYPGLKSNNLLGTYEYSDFPMRGEEYGVKVGQHIPGTIIHEYMERFVDWAGLREYLRLRTKVLGAEETEGGKGWVIKCGETGQDGGQKNYEIRCEKLVVGTGLTCVPMPIRFAGQENFNVPIVNFASLAKVAKTLVADENVKHVTIYGGSKAAHDCVYMFASAGKQVTWVIRRSGHGPSWMAPAYVYLGPFRCWLEKLTTTRFFTWLSPCVWGDADGFGWIRGCLHGTKLGRKVVDGFWGTLCEETLKQTGLTDGNEELKKLVPSESAFWYAGGLGILSYEEDVYGFVRSGAVKVARKDVAGLESGGMVRFADGEVVKTDALVCSSGWRFDSGVPLGPEEKLAGWGVPSTKYSRGQKEDWHALNERADMEILERFPRLATAPIRDQNSLLENPVDVGIRKDRKQKEEYAPWRLWRSIAPPSQVVSGERNLVFLGMLFNITTVVRAEITSLWAYAYLHDQLKQPVASLSTKDEARLQIDFPGLEDGTKAQQEATDKLMYDTALFNRFGKWRCAMGYGARAPDFVFDSVPFFDLLLGDLGLRSWRKGWGWMGEVFGGCYGQSDYRGLVDEWLATKAGDAGGAMNGEK